jgi:hypothetical protein
MSFFANLSSTALIGGSWRKTNRQLRIGPTADRINPTAQEAARHTAGLFLCQHRKETNTMALKLVANYAKRLGLPGYSSHQFSVSVETEIANIDEVATECENLYATLQRSVDEQIQQTGFVPGETYGNDPRASTRNTTAHPGNGTNGGSNGHNGSNGHSGGDNGTQWRCSDKQRALIEKIVRENGLNKHEVESLAQEMFGSGVKHLDKLAASGLIDELLERYGKRRATNGNGYRRSRSNGSGVHA